MKRLALLLALLLFLSGCDLRNRRPSEEFISDGSVPPAQARTSAPAAPPAQTGFLPAEWNGAVKTVLAKEGTFFGAKEIAYSYRIPFLDLADAYAMGCNQEITARFEADAQKSLAQMEQGKPPVVQRVDFTSDLHGTVLSLRLHRLDTDGAESWGTYCVDRSTGAKPTLSAFCEASGVPEGEVPQRLREAAEELTRETAGERYEADDLEYTTALTLTLSGLAEPAALPMHLRADGSLCFVITLYHPGGGTTAEEIVLP